jgi:hypothetical protein
MGVVPEGREGRGGYSHTARPCRETLCPCRETLSPYRENISVLSGKKLCFVTSVFLALLYTLLEYPQNAENTVSETQIQTSQPPPPRAVEQASIVLPVRT